MPIRPDFAVLHQNPASYSTWSRKLDHKLRISLRHPALLVGMKGTQPWPEGYMYDPPSSDSSSEDEDKEPPDLASIIRDLAAVVQPSLDALIMTWQLRQERLRADPSEADAPPKPLPHWLFMYGVIYDAESVTIVAHIPYLEVKAKAKVSKKALQYQYYSVVVDTLPIIVPTEEESGEDQTWLVERARLNIALLTLQKHVFRLTSLYDDDVTEPLWPEVFRTVDDRDEWDFRGISERYTLASTRKFDKYEGVFDPIDMTKEEEEEWRLKEAKRKRPGILKWRALVTGDEFGR